MSCYQMASRSWCHCLREHQYQTIVRNCCLKSEVQYQNLSWCHVMLSLMGVNGLYLQKFRAGMLSPCPQHGKRPRQYLKRWCVSLLCRKTYERMNRCRTRVQSLCQSGGPLILNFDGGSDRCLRGLMTGSGPFLGTGCDCSTGLFRGFGLRIRKVICQRPKFGMMSCPTCWQRSESCSR